MTTDGFVRVSRRRWIAWRAISGIEVSDDHTRVMLTVDRPGDSLNVYVEPEYAGVFLKAIGMAATTPEEQRYSLSFGVDSTSGGAP